MPRIRMPAIYGKVREILPQKRRKIPRHSKDDGNDLSKRKSASENSPVSTTQPDKNEDMHGRDEQRLDVFSYVSPISESSGH
jgi:hypothetical protein